MSSRRKRFSIGMILTGLLLFASFTAAWLGVRGRREFRLPPLPLAVRIEQARTMDLSKSISVSGHVEAKRSVSILSKVSGSLTVLHVEMGDEVEKGDLLLEIDPEPYRLELEGAEAQLASAEAVFLRLEQLRKSDSVSPQRYDEAKAGFDAARSRRDLALLQWENSRVESPFPATVVRVFVSEGDLASPGRPLLLLSDLSQLEISANLPESYYERFALSSREITIDVAAPSLPGRRFRADISAVSPAVDPRSRSFQLRLTVVSPGTLLRPGMFVRITFLLETRLAVPTLPLEALVNGKYLWFESDGAAHRLEYEPEFIGEDRFLLDEGLRHRNFIVDGQHFLREGESVEAVTK